MKRKELLPASAANEPRNQLVTHAQTREISTLLLQDDQARAPDEIDLLAYLRILIKRRLLILSCIGAAMLVALFVTILSTPLYRATAVIQIEQASQQIIREGDLAIPGYSSRDPVFLETQLGLLQSKTLAERVVDDLKMDQATIAQLHPRSFSDKLLSLFRPGDATASAASDEPSSHVAAQAELLRKTGIDMIRDGLTVRPTPNTRLVNVSFSSSNPAFAARVANAITDGFIASEIDRRFGASSYAKTYLEEQLTIARERLEEGERALVSFAQQENLVDVGSGKSLVGQNLADLNAQLAATQGQRIRSQSRLSRADSDATLPQDVLSTSLIPTLRNQLADVQRTYQEKLRIFKPDYPEMLQIQGQIDELNRQIGSEYAAVRLSLRAEYDAAVAQENMLKQQLDSLRNQTLDTSERSIEYNTLRRDADTNRQLYDSLLQRFKQVSAASDVRPDNISIVDRAQVPAQPFSPRPVRNIALGLLLGLLVGVAIALVVEFLDDTLKTPEDIEQQLKLPVLGIIPKLGAKQSIRTVCADPRSAFSEAYRSVRTALQFSTAQGTPRIILVTSPMPAEGKTTTAHTLARNFSQLGKKVLLVEADLRNPSLHKITSGPRGDKGTSNLLTGSATLKETIVPGKNNEPDMIFAGPLPPNPAELLAGVRLRVLLDVALKSYDQIIVDGPPVMGISDSPLLSNAVDSTLFVVQSGRTRIRDAQGAIKRLLTARTRLLGVVLTKYDSKIAGYGYQYQGYYAYGGAPRLGGK